MHAQKPKNWDSLVLRIYFDLSFSLLPFFYVWLWNCSHYALRCVFCKKSVNRKQFLVRTIFFSHLPIFWQLLPNFKDAVESIWRPTILCQAPKLFVPWQLPSAGHATCLFVFLSQGIGHLHDSVLSTLLECFNVLLYCANLSAFVYLYLDGAAKFSKIWNKKRNGFVYSCSGY